MSFVKVREHGLHYPDLDPAWVRERPYRFEDLDHPVDVFAGELETDQAYWAGRADELWAKLAKGLDEDPTLEPGVREVRDFTYGDWREPTGKETADGRRGRRDLDWGVRTDRHGVLHFDGYDAAMRRADNEWPVAVRDVTRSLWRPYGGAP